MANDLMNPSEHENRGEKKSPLKKKSFDFKSYQKNTMNSLHDIEYFLNNVNQAFRYIKIYKIFK